MSWMESSMPACYDAKEEESKVNKLREEVQFLENELAKEQEANKEIQVGIIGRRKRNDELVAMMTLLRSETEAILQRHNILLDSPQANEAAKKLHEKIIKERAAKRETEAAEDKNGAEKTGENGVGKRSAADDQKGGGEDEDGEVAEALSNKGDWGDRGSKRNLDDEEEGLVDESSSLGRKRRKV